MAKYNNLPSTNQPNSATLTVQTFNNYTSVPVELNHSDVMAMTAFFENRGFGPDSAESTALIILQQSVTDGMNAMAVIDTLRGMNDVQLSGLVAEILNYNRFKTSVIGTYTPPQTADVIARNVMI